MSICYKEIRQYEYKRFFSKGVWCWIAICCVITTVLLGYRYKENEQDLVYKEVVEQYHGIATQEKIRDIYEKTMYYSQVLNDHVLVTENYARGNMSDEEFQQFMDDYKYAKRTIEGWEKLCLKAEQFENQTCRTYFFYDVAWEKLFQNDIQIVLIFLISSLFIPYFYYDKESNVCCIAESFFNYQEIKKYRLRMAIVWILMLQILWMLVEICMVCYMSSIPDATATVCSIATCKDVAESFSVMKFYILKNLTLFIKRVIDILLLYFVAEKIESKMQTTIIGFAYLAITNWYYMELLKML